MKKKKCYLFVFDGYADWEPALAIAMLNTYSDFSIHTFSIDGSPVESMGGVEVTPQTSLAAIDPDSIDLLILPGGEAWADTGNEQITPLVKKLADRKGNIAAICDATVFMARHGYLNATWHTSNGPQYLSEKVSSYRGEQWYENLPAVVHDNIITANGAGMIEFAIEILKQQRVMDEETIDKVFDLYKSGGINSRLYQ
jgi:putative intracellular protease/amidase